MCGQFKGRSPDGGRGQLPRGGLRSTPGGGFGGAWTAYPPLSSSAEYSLTPLGSTLWLVAVALEFVAFLLGGINFITTLMNSRTKGMGLYDIPMVLWMIIIASILGRGLI